MNIIQSILLLSVLSVSCLLMDAVTGIRTDLTGAPTGGDHEAWGPRPVLKQASLLSAAVKLLLPFMDVY